MKFRIKPGQMIISLFRRFAPSALICALLALCGIAYDRLIFLPDSSEMYSPFMNCLEHIILSLTMGLFFATAASCLCERFGLRRFIAWICALVGAGVGALLFRMTGCERIIAALILCCLALCLYAVDEKERPGVRLSQVCGWFFVSLGVSLVLYFALMLCCSALFDLILINAPYSISHMVSVAIAYLAYLLFAPWLFLGGLPDRDTPVEKRAGFRKFTAVVLLPLYLLLMGILLLYVVKIAVTLTMPVGVMNGYAIAALTLFVFFRLILTGDENRLSFLFCRFGALLTLPVIAAQAIGVWMRVSAYGLTEARVLGLIWTALCIAVVVCALFRRRAGWFFPAAALIALIILATPISAENIALMNQEGRLRGALTRNGMLDEQNAVTPNPDVSEEEREIIYSAIDYLEDYDSREDSLIARIHAQEDAIRETDPQLSFTERRAQLLGFLRPGNNSGWYHNRYVFRGSAETDRLDTRGVAYAELINVNQWHEDGTWLFDKDSVPSDSRCGITNLPALTAELITFYQSGEPISLTTPVAFLIDGEEIDLAPLLNGLTIDESEQTLTQDRLTLASGKTLCFHEISVHDYSTDDNRDSISFTAWLLTPEAE